MLKSVVTTNLTVTSKANLLGTAATVGNNVESVNTILEDVYSVTIKDIQNAAKKYLAKSNSTTFIVNQNMLRRAFKVAKTPPGGPVYLAFSNRVLEAARTCSDGPRFVRPGVRSRGSAAGRGLRSSSPRGSRRG